MTNYQTTFGVSTTGNVQALSLCLSSVLLGHTRPKAILLRFEGPIPSFGNFYIEQLSDLARHLRVEFSIHRCESQGIRAARDWLMRTCATDYLWMGDDDVIYDPDCLLEFGQCFEPDQTFGYACGTKCDLNNRRGYQNFTDKFFRHGDLKDDAPFNYFWDKQDCRGMKARIRTCDTGNVVIAIDHVLSRGIQFSLFDESSNSGGEDTLFGLQCLKAGLVGYFIPAAQSFHLEKPNVQFNEFNARAEMLLRACELKGLDKSAVKEVFMSGITYHKKL